MREDEFHCIPFTKFRLGPRFLQMGAPVSVQALGLESLVEALYEGVINRFVREESTFTPFRLANKSSLRGARYHCHSYASLVYHVPA
jgi:hypothetical protein